MGGGGENVNTGLDCKGESSTISNLEDLKNERMGFQTSKLVFFFFCKAKTNIYLFILNCCQHCRVSSTWVSCSEVTGLCFDCQDFKINELRCWRSSTGQFGTAARPALYKWPAESPHLRQTQADRQTRGGVTVHTSPHSASHCYLESISVALSAPLSLP